MGGVDISIARCEVAGEMVFTGSDATAVQVGASLPEGQNARLRAVLRCIQALLKRIPNVVCARKKHLVSNLDLDG